ncbi:hypothetical protein MPH_10869 [Macrophomina phaseolina MS6]|uniref:Uncharacterized protein n=1 Tax=Macrophomina phaseolina (strain MS6) TaxID=1126212 RepID=K2RP66_MACPH|nr:hypothetical protein MPH_10869 [Macrophomina phaseolina MS6]
MCSLLFSLVADEAVIQYSQMAPRLPPKTQDLNELQEWMRRPLRGNVRLLGRDRHVRSDGKDLVALKSPPRMYPFAKWIWHRLPRFLTRLGLGPTDTPARLGLIAAFTAVFSTCLWFMRGKPDRSFYCNINICRCVRRFHRQRFSISALSRAHAHERELITMGMWVHDTPNETE